MEGTQVNKNVILFFLTFIFKVCFTQVLTLERNNNPPNCVKIQENLYCDKTEIDNISWHEYIYWTKQVFGENSIEYQSTLPDYNVWNEVNLNFNSLLDNYFTHPAYDLHPVIGITQKQAIEYSKWRSDRYFENLLIINKIISKDLNRNKENYFTIEKFFKGQLKNVIKSKVKIEYFPYFRLPNDNERKIVLIFSDSLEQNNIAPLKKGNSHKLKNKDFLSKNNIICNQDLNSLNQYPVREPNKLNNIFIYDLRGNVAEWSILENIAYGGSWKSDCNEVWKQDSNIIIKQNAYTGFRNVVSWIKWDNTISK